MVNYFSTRTAAERYKNGRPDYHIQTIKRIKDFLNISQKFELSVDIACGTGLSTLPLTNISEKVIGIDLSTEMLSFAEKHPDIEYKVGSAEGIDLPDSSVDLITVASGIHWFDIEKFFSEAKRVLINQGYLIVYENFYMGKMLNQPEFLNWYQKIYLQKFKTPKRNNFDWNNEFLEKSGFKLLETETYENSISFNKKQLINYLTTQSNVINAVENGEEKIEDIEKWFEQELFSFYHDENSTNQLIFNNWIRYLKKI